MPCRADQLSYEIALNLSAYLHSERNYVPWRAFFNSIDFIKGMLSTSNAYGMLKVGSFVQFVYVCVRARVRASACVQQFTSFADLLRDGRIWLRITNTVISP